MIFSSLTFLFAFLPLTLAVYFLAPLRWRNLILLLVSLFFYGWGEPIYITIMFLSILIDYSHGLLVEKYRENDKKARYFVAQSIIFNLLLLGFFKYWDFFAANLSLIPGISIPQFGIPLPIGISFFTFQTMSYTVDVYRKDAPVQQNIINFGAFVTMFPQLIAGPIVKYKTVAAELNQRSHTFENFALGARRFCVGLAKKVLLANSIGALWDAQLAAQGTGELSVVGAWLGLFAFGFQIYFDFSGYSDMAIGLGRIFGFHYPTNFNYPYISKSVTEFWRRWHMTLGSFFRDYVYIPLGGNRKHQWLNIAVVWFLTGLWHGASWNFVLWGLFFFVFLAIEKAGFSKILKTAPTFLSRAYTLIVVYFGWILFRFSDFKFIPIVLKGLVGLNGNGFIDFETKALLTSNLFFIVVAIAAVTPITKKAKEFFISKCDTEKKKKAYEIISIALPVIILILSTLSLVGDSYNPFLYFQF